MAFTENELNQYSPSVQRTLGRPRPRWRGVMHRWAFFASLPIGLAIVLHAQGVLDRIGAASFALGVSLMLGVSAVVHLKTYEPERLEFLFNLDHSAIFLCIATGATAVALMGLDGNRRIILVVAYWLGAMVGLAAVWLPFHPPKGLMNFLFLVLGWTALPMGPALWDSLGFDGMALLGAGAAFYTVGAVIVGSRRPDPDPFVFGYHEIWHLFVVIAVGFHYALVFFVLSA